MGEYQMLISLNELRYLTVTCPACGARVTVAPTIPVNRGLER